MAKQDKQPKPAKPIHELTSQPGQLPQWDYVRDVEQAIVAKPAKQAKQPKSAPDTERVTLSPAVTLDRITLNTIMSQPDLRQAIARGQVKALSDLLKAQPQGILSQFRHGLATVDVASQAKQVFGVSATVADTYAAMADRVSASEAAKALKRYALTAEGRKAIAKA